MTIDVKMKVKAMKMNHKHRWAMLRNLATSLIKHERVEVSEVKAKSLSVLMRKVFDVLYSNQLNENQKDIVFKRIFYNQGAVIKLKENLKNKLGNYQGNEFKCEFSRIRTTGAVKMMNVELIKNPLKRKDDKKELYFIEKIANPYFDFEYETLKTRLHQLFSQHLIFSTLLKTLYNELNASKISITRYLLLDKIDEAFNNLIPEMQDQEILLCLRGQINNIIYDNLIPKDAISFINLYNSDFSKMNQEINNLKKKLEHMESIKSDNEKYKQYNKRYYDKYYSKEKEEFDKSFKDLDKSITKSKEKIRKLISSYKQKEDKTKEIMRAITSMKTESPEELMLLKDIKAISKREKEFRSTYSKSYITGEESGFTELDELENKPKELVALKNVLRKTLVENIGKGRKLEKNIRI